MDDMAIGGIRRLFCFSLAFLPTRIFDWRNIEVFICLGLEGWDILELGPRLSLAAIHNAFC